MKRITGYLSSLVAFGVVSMLSTPPAVAQDDTTGADDANRTTGSQPEENYQPVQSERSYRDPTDIEDLSITEIEDRLVVNLQREVIGEVEDVVMRKDGSEVGLVVGVGGFLGIGEKEVFVALDELAATEQQVIWKSLLNEDVLENLPAYDETQFLPILAEG